MYVSNKKCNLNLVNTVICFLLDISQNYFIKQIFQRFFFQYQILTLETKRKMCFLFFSPTKKMKQTIFLYPTFKDVVFLSILEESH